MQPDLEGAVQEGEGLVESDLLVLEETDDLLFALEDDAVGRGHDRAAAHRTFDHGAVLANALLVPGGQSIRYHAHEGCQPLMLDQLIPGRDGELGQRPLMAAGPHDAPQQVTLLGDGRFSAGGGVSRGYRLLDFCHSSLSSR